MKNGDKAFMSVNGEMIPVEIIETETFEHITRHVVRLEADVQGCKAGETVGETYSKVSPTKARMYGIKRDIFPRNEKG